MKRFNKCNLQDLLLDEDFKFCVWENEKGNSLYWEKLLALNPEEVFTMNQARELLLTLTQKASSLTQQELAEGVAAILSHTTPQKNRFRISRQFRWLSIAAAVLLMLGVFFFKSNNRSTTYSYNEIIATAATPLHEEVNETKQEKRVTLPDSSIVILLPSGKISYANRFIQNKRREIYLSGDAFFDIRKDTVNPLFVYANGLLTRVVGTSFLIKTTEKEVKVLVRTGRVAVTPMLKGERTAQKGAELMLIPNQQALFSTKDQAIFKTNIDFPDQLKNMKKDQVVSFENQPIGEVFESLEKVYGIPFEYDRTVMAKCLLHVAFTNESLFAKLDIITQTIGASYRVVDGRVIVSGKGCN